MPHFWRAADGVSKRWPAGTGVSEPFDNTSTLPADPGPWMVPGVTTSPTRYQTSVPGTASRTFSANVFGEGTSTCFFTSFFGVEAFFFAGVVGVLFAGFLEASTRATFVGSFGFFRAAFFVAGAVCAFFGCLDDVARWPLFEIFDAFGFFLAGMITVSQPNSLADRELRHNYEGRCTGASPPRFERGIEPRTAAARASAVWIHESAPVG